MDNRAFSDHFYVNLDTHYGDRRLSVSGDILLGNFRNTAKNITLRTFYNWLTAEILTDHEEVSSKQLESIISGIPSKEDLENFSHSFYNGNIIINYKEEYYCTISIKVVEEHHWNAITFTFYK